MLCNGHKVFRAFLCLVAQRKGMVIKMKKIISIVSVLAIIICMVSGCSPNKEEIQEELRGTWSYSHYASAVGEQCYQIYKFSGDGTFEAAWVNEDSPSKSKYHEGTYTIKSKEIVLEYSDGSEDDIIEYSYNNGNLKLFDKGSDGSIEKELKKD